MTSSTGLVRLFTSLRSTGDLQPVIRGDSSAKLNPQEFGNVRAKNKSKQPVPWKIWWPGGEVQEPGITGTKTDTLKNYRTGRWLGTLIFIPYIVTIIIPIDFQIF